jgi:AraC-like DNA-binding protein
MSYREYQPHPALAPYVDAYWQISNALAGTSLIMPDGCIDIILNLGAETGGMKHERTYLIGTMLKAKQTHVSEDSCLFGIRFKPAAFNNFYRYAGLHELTDASTEFEQHLLPDKRLVLRDFPGTMDKFLLNRLSPVKRSLFPLLDTVRLTQGQLPVAELARRHHMSVRQLERCFKEELGASPKQFSRFTRYQAALQQIKAGKLPLLAVAIQNGYYDHAHLSNEIKEYTGITPSELFSGVL